MLYPGWSAFLVQVRCVQFAIFIEFKFAEISFGLKFVGINFVNETLSVPAFELFISLCAQGNLHGQGGAHCSTHCAWPGESESHI